MKNQMSEIKTFRVIARCEKCDNVQGLLVGANDELDAAKLTSGAICRICGPPAWEVVDIEEMKNQGCYQPLAEGFPLDGNPRWN
ncbi:hypothetical protein LCGC14_0992130 [marine sediment metagenome]|uniref:Uncharacterized protein n=1 Tax=marine sediment metagenome TaxID=412755 RepID=A0A0F9RC62_9ZZZZ